MFLSIIFNNAGASIQSQPLSLPRIKGFPWTIYLIDQSGYVFILLLILTRVFAALHCPRHGVLQFWMCDFSLTISRINFEIVKT